MGRLWCMIDPTYVVDGTEVRVTIRLPNNAPAGGTVRVLLLAPAGANVVVPGDETDDRERTVTCRSLGTDLLTTTVMVIASSEEQPSFELLTATNAGSTESLTWTGHASTTVAL